jgi:hypothetical protein
MLVLVCWAICAPLLRLKVNYFSKEVCFLYLPQFYSALFGRNGEVSLDTTVPIFPTVKNLKLPLTCLFKGYIFGVCPFFLRRAIVLNEVGWTDVYIRAQASAW